MSSLSVAFRALRHTLDLSVEEIAAIGGVAPSFWRRLEDGTACPTEPRVRSAVQRIADHQTT